MCIGLGSGESAPPPPVAAAESFRGPAARGTRLPPRRPFRPCPHPSPAAAPAAAAMADPPLAALLASSSADGVKVWEVPAGGVPRRAVRGAPRGWGCAGAKPHGWWAGVGLTPTIYPPLPVLLGYYFQYTHTDVCMHSHISFMYMHTYIYTYINV